VIQRAKSVSATASEVPILRAACYCRKSTTKNLDSDLTSLDVQRARAEDFIRSQSGLGWVVLPERYDDGGWSGGDADRPALNRLLQDIEARKVDVVVVYKIDRLSRSLFDFTRLLRTFESHNVALVSVTEPFNSSTSAGRCLLGVLATFSEYERALCRERTKSKLMAARKAGKYTGGCAPLGLSPKAGKLVISEPEAEVVRAAFAIYIERRSYLDTATELNRRGYRTKCYEARTGRRHGGRQWDKGSVAKLLSNALYVGRVCYEGVEYPGEHEQIVDEATWNAVQAIRRANGRTDGVSPGRNRHGFLLKGLVHCKPCDAAMTSMFATKRGRRYSYYLCTRAAKEGWALCPSKSVPLAALEQFVVSKIAAIGRDPKLQAEVAAQARRLLEAEVARLRAERDSARRELKGASAALLKRIEKAGRKPADGAAPDPATEELREKVEALERRVEDLADALAAAEKKTIDSDDVARALVKFDEVFETLTTVERARLLALVLERIDYDGGTETIDLVFRPGGFEALAAENPNNTEIEEPA